MNLFEKINELRERILKLELKKSGLNKFANFYYYELGDFLPDLIVLEKELGISSLFSTKGDLGELIVVNTEQPTERFVLTVGLKEANAKGMLEIQKAGAENTYGKRYAYLNYLNLTESDSVDPLNQKETIEQPDTWEHDKDRINAILTISELLGDDDTKVAQWFKHYEINHDTITPSVADKIISRIKEKQNG